MNVIKHLKENKLLLILSVINFFVIYLSVFNSSYGYFIDEFYYIACANRPAMGYVDHPPLSVLLLTVYQFIFGNSLYAIRIIPALASSTAVLMTGIIAKEFGGGKTAQLISAIGVISAPVLIAFGGFYSMNAFEPLLTLLMVYFLIRLIKTGNIKLWLSVWIIAGLGIMNKHTFVLIIIFLIISFAVTGHYKLMFNKYYILGKVIALIIVLPNIIWQIQNDFPTLEFYKNITLDKNVYTPPLKFIMGQLMSFSPPSILLWLGGFLYFLFNKKYSQYRFVAVFFFISYMFFLISATSRSDRLSFVYPVIFAAGGVLWENFLSAKNVKWLQYPFVLLLLSGLLLAFPVVLPYFNYEKVYAHTQFLGLDTEMEKGKKPPLPQLLADRIGWEEKVNMAGLAYNTLTPDEKPRTIIAGENYGQAGALELYGKKFGFPFAASGHNNYYLWSKAYINNNHKFNILLQLGSEREYEGLKTIFDSVYVYPAEFENSYVSPHENNLRVYICRGPKLSVHEMLENGRNYH